VPLKSVVLVLGGGSFEYEYEYAYEYDVVRMFDSICQTNRR
jgi:hypothetical protein